MQTKADFDARYVAHIAAYFEHLQGVKKMNTRSFQYGENTTIVAQSDDYITVFRTVGNLKMSTHIGCEKSSIYRGEHFIGTIAHTGDVAAPVFSATPNGLNAETQDYITLEAALAALAA